MAKTSQNKGLIWMILGTLMLIAALSLIFYNQHQDKQGGIAAKTVLDSLKMQIPEEYSTEPEPTTEYGYYEEYDEFATEEEEEIVTECLIDIDEEAYVGVLNIPSLSLNLPVCSNWNYGNLNIAPCRYYGSYLDDNMILAAHNFRSHFGRIGELNTGDLLIFTACDGKKYYYEVILTDLLSGTDIEEMQKESEEWDFTLFTCTKSGQNRVTVRAARVGKDTETE